MHFSGTSYYCLLICVRMYKGSNMQSGQSFSVENHPFSIAVLTSPNRRASSSAAATRAPPGSSAPPPGCDVSGTTTATPATPTMPYMYGAYEGGAGAFFFPQQSPMSSTGSTDCSPDTSFSSIASSVLTSPPTSPTLLHPLPVPSPAASEDSGRGSPFLAEAPPRSPGSRTATPDAVRAPSADGSTSNPGSSPEKPAHSYIALISMAILSSPERKLVLADIYQYIMDSYPYYNNQERAWRNSIRHNLSLNECFIKAGRADNGKGNYWAIHPACVDDFSKGDFRRRQARRRARSSANLDHMAAAMAMRCTSYVPMTSSPLGPYHPYLSAGIPALPAYLSPAAAAYAASAYQLSAAPTPTGAHLHTATTTTSADLHHHTTTTSSGQQQAAFPPGHFPYPAHALMAAYGSLCAGAPRPVASGHMTPATPGSTITTTSSMVPPGGAIHGYGQQRYSPYGRIPTQLLW